MPHRLEKINQLLKKEIGQILLKELDFADVLVTITTVETSVDLKQAKIMISVLPFEKSQKVLEILNRQIFDFQQILNKKLKMKSVPKIYFKIDEGGKQQAKIIELLNKIGNE